MWTEIATDARLPNQDDGWIGLADYLLQGRHPRIGSERTQLLRVGDVDRISACLNRCLGVRSSARAQKRRRNPAAQPTIGYAAAGTQ
jgi:hypothetical protein